MVEKKIKQIQYKKCKFGSSISETCPHSQKDMIHQFIYFRASFKGVY